MKKNKLDLVEASSLFSNATLDKLQQSQIMGGVNPSVKEINCDLSAFSAFSAVSTTEDWCDTCECPYSSCYCKN